MPKKPETPNQPEFDNMPRLPAIDKIGRLYLNQKSDMNAAWDRAEEELKKTGDRILEALAENKLASYRVMDVDGSEKVFERLEKGAVLRVRKAGKPGAGRPRKAK